MWTVRKKGYSSTHVVESKVLPGVKLMVARVSFGRRVELMMQVRDMHRKSEFLRVGEEQGDKMDAALEEAEVQRLYVMWGVRDVSGLLIDGKTANVLEMIQYGPEELFQEALEAVRREMGLSEDERKN